jgi:NTE family protein
VRALVLSGGGPLAVAWEHGLIAGLARRGIKLAQADYILGTSAGAIVGAPLAAGLDPELLAQKTFAERGAAELHMAARPLFSEGVAKLPEIFAKAHGGAGEQSARLAEIGGYALAAPTDGEDFHLECIAGEVPVAAWPQRAFGCAVVDAVNGQYRVLDRDCGGGLLHAVAASCSVPGLTAPITIAGRRYMDGGLRSAANADFAAGYDRVLVVSFRPAGPVGGYIAAQLERELVTLRQADAAVHVIAPDEMSLQAIGANPVDVLRRPGIVKAALAQGEACAGAVPEFWR